MVHTEGLDTTSLVQRTHDRRFENEEMRAGGHKRPDCPRPSHAAAPRAPPLPREQTDPETAPPSPHAPLPARPTSAPKAREPESEELEQLFAPQEHSRVAPRSAPDQTSGRGGDSLLRRRRMVMMARAMPRAWGRTKRDEARA